jgi:hypothetical protein
MVLIPFDAREALTLPAMLDARRFVGVADPLARVADLERSLLSRVDDDCNISVFVGRG